jgi:hypothetical protein
MVTTISELQLVEKALPYLEAKTDPQHEGGHTGDESAEEGIEGKSSHQATVHKLKTGRAVQKYVEGEGVRITTGSS